MTASTIPELYDQCAKQYGHRIASYHKDTVTDRWIATTWHEGQSEINSVAAGLLALGVQKGDRVGILSETRREWSTTDMAIVCSGAVTVGIYPTSTPEQCSYILNHAEVEICFIEDKTQLDRLSDIDDDVPSLRKLVLFEDAGTIEDPRVLGLDDLKDLGNVWLRENKNSLEERTQEITEDDLAMLVYTSGTTGPPKGVMLTHKNICKTVQCVAEILPHRSDDIGIVFLPLAHSLQRVAGYAGMVTGITGVYAERIDKIVDHMQDFKPTVQAAVPRIYEKIHARIMSRLEDASPAKQTLFRWAIDVGSSVTKLQVSGQPVPVHMQVQHRLADRLVLRKIRDVFGGRIRYMISGAAPIAIDLLEFFQACGLQILEGYGLTETTAPATVNRIDQFKFGTVGLDLPICETRIADDGEILIKGANVFKGYYRNEEATKEAFTDDGWFKSGDIGTKDEDGYLKITDRKKELIITAGGKNISPANIENTVKATSPLVSQCVVYGDKRKFLVGLIALDPEELTAMAARLGLPKSDYVSLTQHSKIIGEVQLIVDKSNRELARYETIKYFRVLPKELSIEDDLLTPTLKLKRRNIYATYESELHEMYETAATQKRKRMGDMAI